MQDHLGGFQLSSRSKNPQDQPISGFLWLLCITPSPLVGDPLHFRIKTDLDRCVEIKAQSTCSTAPSVRSPMASCHSWRLLSGCSVQCVHVHREGLHPYCGLELKQGRSFRPAPHSHTGIQALHVLFLSTFSLPSMPPIESELTMSA